jgi:hypothetical protein
MVMKEKTLFDFERFKEEAMQGLYNGKSLSPNDGVLAPLMSCPEKTYSICLNIRRLFTILFYDINIMIFEYYLRIFFVQIILRHNEFWSRIFGSC